MHKVNQYDEKLLLAQIAEGDHTSFRILFDFYKSRLFTFAYGLTHSKVDAEEIVQDVFMKLWESKEKLTAIEYPQTYIFTMARNRTLDVLIKTANNQKLIQKVWTNINQSDDQVEKLLLAKETENLINDAVAKLSQRKQQIYHLSRTEGLSLDEIAGILGISKQTVKNNLSESIKEIKENLRPHLELTAVVFLFDLFL